MREISFEQAGWPTFVHIAAEVLDGQGALRFKARGSSMIPFIRHGDILTVQAVNVMDLKKGDIALYRTDENKLVTHRIIGLSVLKRHRMLQARGDSILGPIENLRADQIIGRVVCAHRRQKTVQLRQGVWKYLPFIWMVCYPIPQRLIFVVKKIKQAVLFILNQIQFIKTHHI